MMSIVAGVLMLVGVFTLPVDLEIDAYICRHSTECPCRLDAQCYGELLRADFTGECVAQIERLAVDGFQWTDRQQDQPLFTEFSWVNRFVGNVTMKGDRAELLLA